MKLFKQTDPNLSEMRVGDRIILDDGSEHEAELDNVFIGCQYYCSVGQLCVLLKWVDGKDINCGKNKFNFKQIKP
jgi:hypothetical protein